MLGFFSATRRAPIEQPEFWLVAFHEEADAPWVNWVPGRFKHVSLVGYFRDARSWVLMDPSLHGMRIVVYADTDAGLNELGLWVHNARVVRMPALSQDMRDLAGRPGRLGLGRAGYWCVPVVRHALGLRSRALLPDRLLRDCLENGGTIAMQPGDEIHDVNAEGQAGSGSGKPEGDLQAEQAGQHP